MGEVTRTAVDLSKFQKAPNGFSMVLKRESATEIMRAKHAVQLKEPEPLYVPTDGEVRQLMAALKANLPIAFVGSAGIGKTTLVSYAARKMNVPLTTVSAAAEKKLWELVGAMREISVGNGDAALVYTDGPFSFAARSQERSVLYVDEAIGMRASLFTSLSSVFDHRASLPLDSTGEELLMKHIMLVLAFNPPEMAERDLLPKEAALDRLVMVRFKEQTGVGAHNVLKVKYGIERMPGSKSLGPEMSIEDALKAYGTKLEKVYSDLNSQTAVANKSVIVKRVTPRSMENTLRLIAAGLSPQEAVMMAMAVPMAPLQNEMVNTFITAAEQVIAANLGRAP